MTSPGAVRIVATLVGGGFGGEYVHALGALLRDVAAVGIHAPHPVADHGVQRLERAAPHAPRADDEDLRRRRTIDLVLGQAVRALVSA